jgi:hypothetical protein
MRIKGIEKRNIEIEITPIDAVLSLAEFYGLSKLFKNDSDHYSSLEGKMDGIYLVDFENHAYHGTPRFDMVSEKKLTADEAIAAKALKELYTIAKK